MSWQPMAGGGHTAALRVLVVGIDEHYRERAQAVLGELGSVTFAVTRPTDPTTVGELVRHEQADVVVLDATDCEAAAADVVAALANAAPRLGVVVVCEHLTGSARDLGALPKWGWTRDLLIAVQRARIDGSPLARRPSDLTLAGRRDPPGVAPGSIARR